MEKSSSFWQRLRAKLRYWGEWPRQERLHKSEIVSEPSIELGLWKVKIPVSEHWAIKLFVLVLNAIWRLALIAAAYYEGY